MTNQTVYICQKLRLHNVESNLPINANAIQYLTSRQSSWESPPILCRDIILYKRKEKPLLNKKKMLTFYSLYAIIYGQLIQALQSVSTPKLS